MTFFITFLVIAFFFGPGMAITYGLGNPVFEPVPHLIALLIIESLSVIVIYGLLYRLPLERRFENKILDKIAVQVHTSRRNVTSTTEKISGIFRRNFGDLGFYLALSFASFAYGPFIGAAIAYFLKVQLRRAILSITIGAAVSIVFWWYMALGMIPFITPTLVFVVMTCISAAFILYGWTRENRIVKMISDNILNKKDFLLEKTDQILERRNAIKEKRKELTRDLAEGVKEIL
jgi:uncharacterized membrane protein